MSKRLNSLKEIAYKEALKGTGKQRHGAVVIGSGGRVLAKACNTYHNQSHAETRAINRIPHDARELAEEIIVVRLRKSQKYGLSKPCSKCRTAIKEANIKVVYYSTDGEMFGFDTY